MRFGQVIRAVLAAAFAVCLAAGAATGPAGAEPAAGSAASPWTAEAQATALLPGPSVLVGAEAADPSEGWGAILDRLKRESMPEPAQYCPYGIGYYCVTQFGTCQLGGPLCRGQACYCVAPNGQQVWGTVD